MPSSRVSTVARLTTADLPVPDLLSTPAPNGASGGASPGGAHDARPAGTLRVPALLALGDGELLLVHDFRPTPRSSDWQAGGGALPDDLPNPNSLWLRRSDDAGATWSAPRRLIPGEPACRADGAVPPACRADGAVPPALRVTGVSDPSLVLGPDGAVHLFAAGASDVGLFGAHAPTRPVDPQLPTEPGTLRLLHAVSRDRGETWAWEDLTDLCLAGPSQPDGVVAFPVSGHGTCVAGRLVQPLVLALPSRPDGSRPVRAQALVSDDAGATWFLAAPIPAPVSAGAASLAGGAATSGVDEWAVAGLPGTSTLVVSARDGGYGGTRLVARSQDAGRGWSVPQPEPALPDPGCNGGLVAVPVGAAPSSAEGGAWMLVCSHAANPTGRRHGRLTASRDGGRSWEVLADLTGPDEPFAYSDLAWVPSAASAAGQARLGTLVVVAEDPHVGDLVVRA